MPSKIVLVTGASSGIGAACAELLSARGYTVFGSSRSADFHPVIFRPVVMDVLNDQSVTKAISEIVEQAGTIDVLINNAGCGLAGAIEDTSTEEALHQMNVNFMGAFHVTKAVLPAMRQHHSGIIVNVSSLGGRFGLPFQGFYSASKFALEGWTESLSYEVRPFGIRAALVEPGDVRTGFTGNRMVAAAGNRNSVYAASFARCLRVIENEERRGVSPDMVARLICGIVEGRASGFRYTCGHASQRLSAVLNRLLPANAFRRIIAHFYRL